LPEDKRLGYNDSVVLICSVPGCKKWHKLQIKVRHEVHLELKKMVKIGRFMTLQELNEYALERFVDGGAPGKNEILPRPARHEIIVKRKDLEAATITELRLFRDEYGLSGKTRPGIIRSAETVDWVTIR